MRCRRESIRGPDELPVRRATALPLHLGAASFAGEPAVDRPTGRTGGPPWRRRGSQRLTQLVGQPDACGFTVAPLGAVLGGIDGEDAAVEPRSQSSEQPGSLHFGEHGRGGDVERQLHPGVRRVHALTARPGGPRIALDQFARRDHQSTRHSRARIDAQFSHQTTVRRRAEARAVASAEPWREPRIRRADPWSTASWCRRTCDRDPAPG